MQSHTIIEPINPKLAYEENLSLHPWIEPWLIQVSEGFSCILDNYLREIQEILGSDQPKLAFLRIIEELDGSARDSVISSLYQRRFRIFIEPKTYIKARNEALIYSTAQAIGISLQTCFRCGRPLEVKDIKDKDEREKFPFLPVAPSDCYSSTISVCLDCAQRDWQKEQKAVKEVNTEAENADGTAERWEEIKAAEKKYLESTQEEALKKNSRSEYERDEFDALLDAEEVVEVIKPVVAIFSTDEVDKLSDAYADAPRDQASRVKSIVKKIRKGSPLKQLVIIPEQWREFCDDLSEKFPNFSEVNLFIRNQLALSAASDNVLRLPPIILVGNPGIGKTEWSLSVSEELNTILKVIDISNSQTGSPLTGSESHWSNSQSGMLFHTLVLEDIANPIVMLDEIDKARGRIEYNPLAALHQLLEPRQAKNFHDLSVPELGIDASHVIWIATANSVEGLEGPIVDRFTVFNIADPSKEQMPAIVTNQYLRFLDKHPSGSVFERTIRDDVLKELCGFHPRKVRKILELAFGLAAYDNRDYLTVKDVKVGDVGDKQRPGIGFMSSIEPV
jgi:ATP-dependent Lon protease